MGSTVIGCAPLPPAPHMPFRLSSGWSHLLLSLGPGALHPPCPRQSPGPCLSLTHHGDVGSLGALQDVCRNLQGYFFSDCGDGGQQQWGCPAPPGPAPQHPCPPPSCSGPPRAQGWVAASQAGAPRDPGPWLLWPAGPCDQWPSILAPHPRGTAGHRWPVLPSWQSRELCAFSTRIPPGCEEAASELVRRRDQLCPPVPLPVLPLHPKGCPDPVPKPIPLSSSITHLTCTSKGFIKVSTRPWAGTTGISLPQSSLELRASVLTVIFTSPADASGTLSPHGASQPAPQPHGFASALGLCVGLAGLGWGSPG